MQVGFITKEQVRKQYDGSLFHELARKNNLQDSDLIMEVSLLKLLAGSVVAGISGIVALLLFESLRLYTD